VSRRQGGEGVSMLEKAIELEEACKHYLANYKEALVRVAGREMMPIIDRVVVLGKETGTINETQRMVLLYEYLLPRATEQQPQQGAAVFFEVDERALCWLQGLLVSTPMGVALLNPLGVAPKDMRRVTFEDLSELNVTPQAMVERLGEMASALQIHLMQNMPAGQA
jgi:hypothetical protein